MGLKLATDQDLNIPHLTKENIKKLKILQDEVIRNNLNFNLISKSSELNIWNRHIIDSAQLLNFFPKELKSFIDIGSGAGFPGLVVKILNTSLEGHLVESNFKKANFLKNMSKKIGVNIISTMKDLKTYTILRMIIVTFLLQELFQVLITF